MDNSLLYLFVTYVVLWALLAGYLYHLGRKLKQLQNQPPR